MDDHNFIIDVKNLNKSFDDKQVVFNVNLQIKKGEIFGFLGPNGSGKTTTIRMICGLLIPDSGSGTCLGYDILKESLEIKKNVGYMTQFFSLYDELTPRENLNFIARMYGLINRKQKVNDCIDRLGFSKARQKQLTGNLSGGWKQRLSLAGAMLHEPKVLLLDEPTAGVDPKARREFWDQIHELSAEGITTLVSTHYMDEAERCHKLGYIAYGHLLANGTIDDIIDFANIHLWTVTDDNVHPLAVELRKQPTISQVTVFGRTLHVVGKDPDALLKAIKPYRTKEYRWRQAQPSIEDVFIHLVGTAKDNFA